MTTVEILRGAKVELAKRGWQQGRYGSGDGPVCLLGACAAAAGVLDRRVGDYRLADVEADTMPALMAALDRPNSRNPLDWNDDNGRTIDDVQALLDRAITLAEGK